MNQIQQHSVPYIGEGLSKSQITELLNLSIESVLEEGNVFQVAEAVSAMETFVKEFRKEERFVDYVREELGKNNGKFTTASGAKIEACETGTSYDFSQCNDSEYSRLEKAFLQVKEELDQRKEFLKTVSPKGLIVTDPDSGETSQIFPPSKSSKSSYKITLAK